MITAEQLKRTYKDDPKTISHALAETLRDFGYSSTTDEWVREEVDRLLSGEEPRGGPSMFLKGWLEEGIE